MNKKKLTPRELCLIGTFTAILAVTAQISIPMPWNVPLTMQTFAIILMGIVLGPRKGFVSAVVYLLLGAIGIPVFSNLGGGLAWIVGPTGGFLLSYPLMTLLIGKGAERLPSKAPLVLGIAAGIVINYIFGMVMYSFVSGNSLSAVFTACVLPFIPTDIIKAVAAGTVGARIKKYGFT